MYITFPLFDCQWHCSIVSVHNGSEEGENEWDMILRKEKREKAIETGQEEH